MKLLNRLFFALALVTSAKSANAYVKSTILNKDTAVKLFLNSEAPPVKCSELIKPDNSGNLIMPSGCWSDTVVAERSDIESLILGYPTKIEFNDQVGKLGKEMADQISGIFAPQLAESKQVASQNHENLKALIRQIIKEELKNIKMSGDTL